MHDHYPAVNASAEPRLQDLIQARLTRRTVMGGGIAAAAAFLAGGNLFTGMAEAATAPAKGGLKPKAGPKLGFTGIPTSTADDVVVPAGYTATPFIPWGTPLLGSYPAFSAGTPGYVTEGNTAAQQAQQVGAHHDGMWYFPLAAGSKGSEHGLLVVNHEYVDEGYLHKARFQTSKFLTEEKSLWTLEMVRKSQNAHGVSVIEIKKSANGAWNIVKGSPRNRRITATTAMTFTGPAAGHRLLRTAADPAGKTPLGTFNNCANGYTPWGTYLTCEENFNGYFRLDAGSYSEESAALNTRYGIGGDRNNWATKDDRFAVTASNPNEPNRHGWVVEIDPMNPKSTPVKRTALGRMKHEGATVHETKGGRVVAYMGDDQANEFVYKFVSSGNWRSMRAKGKSPLDEGTLYVAKFSADGKGQWLPLVHGQGGLTAANGFADQGDVLVKARLAATTVGATPMDRPEWTSVDPTTGMVYLTLTNNNGRTEADEPNPRIANKWGHIIRWTEAEGDHAATAFTWDIFVLAGPGRDSAKPEGSTVLAEDAFGSPDGLWVDGAGRVWIQNDGSQPGGANDQMLVADPAVADAQGVPEIRRFFTGVKGAEVTGIAVTPDQRTMFVNIQHPGEAGVGSWPEGGSSLPRSGTVVITKDDGGVIGS